jgi:S1-C subfamily serine protease
VGGGLRFGLAALTVLGLGALVSGVRAQEVLQRVEEDLVRIADRVRPAVVGIQVERAFPYPAVALSGICIDGQGSVATVGLPLAEAEVQRISIRFHDGRSFRARLAGVGTDRRIALLRVEGADELPRPPLGEAARLRAGSLVVTLGTPLGLPSTFSFGCVSALDVNAPPYAGLLQTTVPVRQGEVGGVVADVRGEIVAMVVGSLVPSPALQLGSTAPASRAEDGLQIPAGWRLAIAARAAESASAPPAGIALPIERVLEEARALADSQGIPPPSESRRWLGISVEDEFEPALRLHLGLPEGRGLLVRRVYEGSPAGHGGIEPLDVLLGADEKPLGSIASLRAVLETTAAGGTISFEVLRRGRPVRITVNVE